MKDAIFDSLQWNRSCCCQSLIWDLHLNLKRLACTRRVSNAVISVFSAPASHVTITSNVAGLLSNRGIKRYNVRRASTAAIIERLQILKRESTGADTFVFFNKSIHCRYYRARAMELACSEPLAARALPIVPEITSDTSKRFMRARRAENR